MRTCRADRPAHRLGLVTSQIVHHDHIAGAQGRNQNPFDTGPEDVAIHGAIEHLGRIDAVMAQGSDEGGGVPVPEGCRAPGRRSPLGARPRSGAMFVFIQVSSMKTSRVGSIRP